MNDFKKCDKCGGDFQLPENSGSFTKFIRICDKCVELRRKEKENQIVADSIAETQIMERKALSEALKAFPKKYSEARLKDFDHFSPKIRETAIKWLDGDRSWCLFLDGPTGTGKTHISYGILRESFRHGFKNCRSFFALDLVRYLQDDYKTNTQNHLKEVMALDLLIIDDMGAERLTEDSKQQISTVIHHREQDISKTIITSNLNLSAIEEAYSSRVSSRIKTGMGLDLKTGTPRKITG